MMNKEDEILFSESIDTAYRILGTFLLCYPYREGIDERAISSYINIHQSQITESVDTLVRCGILKRDNHHIIHPGHRLFSANFADLIMVFEPWLAGEMFTGSPPEGFSPEDEMFRTPLVNLLPAFYHGDRVIVN